MANQPTLFSFFTKSQTKAPLKTPVSKKKNKVIDGKEIKPLDLVWAKLEGYPWWPAIVFENPTDKVHIRKKQIHVQFFDDPPTRGWVKDSFVKAYGDPEACGIPIYKDPLWVQAKITADSATALQQSERTSLIVEMEPSDDENSTAESENLNDTDDDAGKENISSNISSGKKRQNLNGSDSSAPKSKKRRIVLLSESELSEDEYKPNKVEESSDDSSVSSGVAEENITSEEEIETESEQGTPVKVPVTPKQTTNAKSHTPKSQPNTPKLNSSALLDSTRLKIASFSAKENSTKAPTIAKEEVGAWPHTKLLFLKSEHIKDAMKHSPDHPDYDSRTLFVPDDFLTKQTPAMRQWWDIKSQHFDTVLFFKMGKFYELFHMDALLAIHELGLIMMKGENAHVGFPEISYGRYSATLIERGYKVARIEQTETPDMMEKRCKKTINVTKFDKVVHRELCQVTSLGTRIPSVMDGDASDTSSSFLLAICERNVEGLGDNTNIGVAFIDTSIGTFHLGQFDDDRHLSRLRTLLAHYPPAQILIERGRISTNTLRLVKSLVPLGLLENLSPEKEFWTASKTISVLSESEFLKNENNLDWPESLKTLFDEGDSLGQTIKNTYELGVSSLGAIIWYLTLCKLEEDLISRRMFEIYLPPDCMNETMKTPSPTVRKHMIVDGTALRNLEIFENSSGDVNGTLFDTLNFCQTPFGKRLLHTWLCAPLCLKESIDSRLDAIEDLRKYPEIVDLVKRSMSSLPDLEKILSKIHSQGLKHSANHPDSRAIFFESQQYSQRKVNDFLAAVDGFNLTVSIIESFKEVKQNLESSLLKQCVCLQNEDGKFPELTKILNFFQNAFDHNLAKKEGKIMPSKGIDQDYDNAMKRISEIKHELDDYLKEQCKYFSCQVTYWGNEKKRFQLEVPDQAAKKVDNKYELVSQKKGYKRYWTQLTKSLLNDMMIAEEQRENVLQDIARRIFKQFDEHAKEWKSALECISVLDVLLSLTIYSLQVETTRPTIVSLSREEKPFIDIREGRHPCSIKIYSGGDYIPNDVVVGSETEDSHSNLVLITGPNMGGKSTLMRQTALICLMAQLGSYVPASECSLSPVDRIFTRLGAWDKIFQGESTFFVELAETASFIHHATPHSLVIVDELGRGTATYDGTAIAFAVLDALSKIGCRTLFSTHYHSLVDDFKDVKGISLGHMSCMVEGENEEDPSQETITFLYKFVEGACPKSYGFNAARLAELPESIIRCANLKAIQLEQLSLKKRNFRSIFGGNLLDLSKKVILNLKSGSL